MPHCPSYQELDEIITRANVGASICLSSTEIVAIVKDLKQCRNRIDVLNKQIFELMQKEHYDQLQKG